MSVGWFQDGEKKEKKKQILSLPSTECLAWWVKNFSRGHSERMMLFFFFFSFLKIWFDISCKYNVVSLGDMQIVSIGDNLLELSNPIF